VNFQASKYKTPVALSMKFIQHLQSRYVDYGVSIGEDFAYYKLPFLVAYYAPFEVHLNDYVLLQLDSTSPKQIYVGRVLEFFEHSVSQGNYFWFKMRPYSVTAQDEATGFLLIKPTNYNEVHLCSTIKDVVHVSPKLSSFFKKGIRRRLTYNYWENNSCKDQILYFIH